MRELERRAGWLSTTPPSFTQETIPPAEQQSEDGPPWPVAEVVAGGPRLARGIVLAVLTAYAVNQTIDLATAPLPSHGAELAVDIPAIALLYVLTVWCTSAAAQRWSSRQRLVVLLAEALLTYIPIAIFGKLWGDMAGDFAGSALLLLSGWVAWTVFMAAIGSILVLSALSTLSAYSDAYLTISTMILGLVVFGLARLSHLISYVHATRGELAQLAIINERIRFARDLHDLLGYSLSAITLKAELTRRLVGTNSGRARDELAEVLDIARQALADVRVVATGYRNISLAKEASSVTSLLAAANVSAQVDVNCGMLDEKVDTALATVLREAVTNMLRHSTARNCTIEARVAGEKIRLLIANDGVPPSAASGRQGGGLENLSTRMEAIGGELHAQISGNGWFSVHAEAPFAPMTTEVPGPDGEPGKREESDGR